MNIKALYIICNAGFSSEVMEIARSQGAKGATIMNARGESRTHKSILGITVDTEKEMILMLIEDAIAEKIMTAVQAQAGLKTPAHALCYTMPVERTTKINDFETEPNA